MCHDAEAMKAAAGAPEHARRRRLQDPGRSAADPRRALPAEILDRRMAAVVERAPRRHVAGRARVRRFPARSTSIERWQRRRLRMRPGLTCLWAISGRDDVDFETWMKMDMQYIDNWSLALGLEDPAAHHSARADRPGGQLDESRYAPDSDARRSGGAAPRNRRAARRPFRIPQRAAFQRIPAGAAGDAAFAAPPAALGRA